MNTGGRARLDHVVLAVPDLEAGAAKLLEEYGLASVEGGRHPGWGTANRIVPLGPEYLELVTVVDETEAQTNPYGQAVSRSVAWGGGPVAWCLAVEDVEEVAARLGGLSVSEGSRERPDGTTLRWRLAGLEVALSEPCRPFYMQWQIPEGTHPGRAEVSHRVEPLGIAAIEVACEPQLVREWTEDAEVELRVVPGPPPLHAVAVATREGEITVAGV